MLNHDKLDCAWRLDCGSETSRIETSLATRKGGEAMPLAKVRGVNMNYKVLGNHGPWVALSPGGRRDISGIELLAGKVAEQGYRVVVFDRRNTGASEVVIDGNDSEYEIWADDVHELLRQLRALPAIVGGSSSGCRTALLFALRHPESVHAL